MANKLLSLSPFSGNVLQKYEKYRQETSFASLIKVKEASKACVYQENVTFNKKERAPARAEALPKCCAIIFVFDLLFHCNVFHTEIVSLNITSTIIACFPDQKITHSFISNGKFYITFLTQTKVIIW